MKKRTEKDLEALNKGYGLILLLFGGLCFASVMALIFLFHITSPWAILADIAVCIFAAVVCMVYHNRLTDVLGDLACTDEEDEKESDELPEDAPIDPSLFMGVPDGLDEEQEDDEAYTVQDTDEKGD